MINITRRISNKGRKKYIFVLAVIIGIIFILYVINSFLIKPNINSDNLVSFFMINFFNDFLASVLIAAFANILSLRKNIIFNNFIFYMALWFTESIIWEFLRPLVLLLFNPFNKEPHFLWGDIVIYFLGTTFLFLKIQILDKKVNKHGRT